MTESEWGISRDPRAMLQALFTSDLHELQGKPVTGPRSRFAVSEERHEQVAAAFARGRPPRGHAPDARKFLLFVAACIRRAEHLFLPAQRGLLDLHERDADDSLNAKE